MSESIPTFRMMLIARKAGGLNSQWPDYSLATFII
jgi:hypothetical protein